MSLPSPSPTPKTWWSDTDLDSADSDGVALAAIQGLNDVVQEQGERLAQKDAEIAAMQAELAAIREQIEDLVEASPR